MAKFDWNQFEAEKPAPKGGKFDWNQFEAEPEAPKVRSLGAQFLDGLVSVGKKVDSYTGAPTRAAISSLQNEVESPGKAIGAFARQFGEDPDRAPTGKSIVMKAGVPDRDIALQSKAPASGDADYYRFHNDPKFREQYLKSGKGSSMTVNPAGIAGLGMDIVADPTNVIPVSAMSKGIATGAAKLTSKAVNAAADATSGAGKLLAKGGKRAMEGVFGVSDDAITRYLARHPKLKDRVGAREMMEELAGRVDEGLKPARANLAAAEESVERAKLARSEDLAELQIKRQEMAESLRRAEDSALGEAASRVSSRVAQLDDKVKAGSSKSFDILDQEGAVVPTQQLKSRMTAGIKALEERAVTDEQMKVVELLTRYRERLDKFGKEIPGGEAKRILQSLDREMSFVAPGEIGRMSKPDQALGALRRHIDEPLKKSPAYAAQMGEVSRLMGILENVKPLSSDSAAARALRAAKGATGKDQMEAIQKLASEFGDDFLAAADRRNLPEYNQLKGLLYRVREARKGKGVTQAEQALEATRGQLGDAVDLGRGGVAGITDKINATVRQSVPGAVQTQNLERAGKMAGVNMADELADIRTIASFEKGYNRGSANTNFWGAVVGALSGSVFGPGGAIGGAAAGGAFGRMVIDNFGPKVARTILDQVPMLQKVDAAQWIRSLDVPAQVKAQLAQDLAAYRQISQGTKGAVAAVKPLHSSSLRRVADQEKQDAPAKGEERWARTGLQKLGISDQSTAQKLLASKESKRLLIEASDLLPGSPALKQIKERLKGIENDSLSGTETEILRQQRKPARGR